MRTRLPILLAAATAALALSCDQRPADPVLPAANIEWKNVQSFGFDLSVKSIWASGDDDVYVGSPSSELFGDVGFIDQPRVFHYDGSSWRQMNLPISEESGESSIWGVDANNVYVAIEKLHHFDGVDWNVEPIDAQFVTGTASDNVFAASRRSVFHFTGASWDTLLTTNSSYFRRISAAPDGSLWVSTDDSVLVWNNSTWSGAHWPTYAMDGLTAFSAHEAVAMLSYWYEPRTEIYRWNGVQWNLETTLPASLENLWADGPSSIYGVGRGKVVHFDGVNWTQFPRATSFDLKVAFVPPSGHLLVAGGTGKVSRFDGSAWHTLREGKLSQPNLLWAESPSGFLVQDYGNLLFKRDGDSWTEEVLPIGAGVAAFGGTSLHDLYASLGNGAMVHYDGTNWAVAVDSMAVMHDMWAGPSGKIFGAAFGAVYRFDGSWQPIVQGELHLTTISGDDAGRIVAGGTSPDGRVVMFFDGSEWHQLPFPFSNPVGVCIDVTGQVFVVADYGGLYRYDGAKFIAVTPPRTASLHDAFGLNRGVIAFGIEVDAVYEDGILNLQSSDGSWSVNQTRNGEFIALTRAGVGVWKP